MENNYYKKYGKLISPTKGREELDGYTLEYENFALSYLTLRKTIGYLGIALPILCLLSSLFNSHKILPSISHYYHSSTKIYFAAVLLFLAIFLFSYKGGDKYESGVCKALASLALLIVFFPTTNSICIVKKCYTENDLNSFIMPAVVGLPWIGIIHLFCAFIFFVLLIYLIFFKFLTSEKRENYPDPTAIIIYKICGWGMIIAIACIGLSMILFGKESDDWTIPPTFLCETFALIFFGVSWLTKGETFSKR